MEEKEEEIHIDLPDAKCMHQQRQTFVVDSVGEVPCTTEVWAAGTLHHIDGGRSHHEIDVGRCDYRTS